MQTAGTYRKELPVQIRREPNGLRGHQGAHEGGIGEGGFLRMPSVKDMSRWHNRFCVLEEEILSDSSKTQKTMSTFPLPHEFPQKIYIRSNELRLSTQIHIQLKTLDTNATMDLHVLLDSGAPGLFLDTQFVRVNKLNTRRLPRAIPVYNVDGTLNQGGSITEEVDMILTYKDHTEKATFAVC